MGMTTRTMGNARWQWMIGVLAMTGACGESALGFRSVHAVDFEEVDEIAEGGAPDLGGGGDTDGSTTDASTGHGTGIGEGSLSGSGPWTSGSSGDASSDGGSWTSAGSWTGGTDGDTGIDVDTGASTAGTDSGGGESGASSWSSSGAASDSDSGSAETDSDSDSAETGATADTGDTTDTGGTGDTGGDTGGDPPDCGDEPSTWSCPSSDPDDPCECAEPEPNPNPEEPYEPAPPSDDSCAADEPADEMQLAPLAEPPPKTAELTVKYSRGNNDKSELEAQFKAAGVYQYETASLDITAKADRSACTCTDGKYAGEMTLKVKFSATGIKPEEYRDAMKNNYFMICGEAPVKATTMVGAMKDPGPDLKTYALSTKIGKLTDGVTFTEKDGVFSGEVTCKLTCDVGERLNRVYLPPKSAAGKDGIIYEPPKAKTLVPTAYIDTKINIADDGKITLEPRYVEYIAGYRWLEATKAELATVDVVWSVGAMEKSEKTWQIAKLIHDGTKKVGEPFKPDKTGG